MSTIARGKLARPYGWPAPAVPTFETRPGATCIIYGFLFGQFNALLSLRRLNGPRERLDHLSVAPAIRSVTWKPIFSGATSDKAIIEKGGFRARSRPKAGAALTEMYPNCG